MIWSTEEAPDGAIERLTEALARASGARRPFTVVASVRSVWVWIAPEGAVDDEKLRDELPTVDGVRVALGAVAEGLDGFRRSHLEALATQRLMQRMPLETSVASYREVEVVALSTSDEQRASEFVRRRLGDLLGADPVLSETLRVYIREQFNTSAAARALFAHRNTVINRLERARDLLPAPLEGRGLEVGLALEMQHWLGAGTNQEAA